MLERNNSQHKIINSLKTPSTKKVSSHISTMDSGGVIASPVFSLVAVVFCLYGWFVDVWLAVNMVMILRSLSSHQTGGCWVKIVTHCHARYIYIYLFIYIYTMFFFETRLHAATGAVPGLVTFGDSPKVGTCEDRTGVAVDWMKRYETSQPILLKKNGRWQPFAASHLHTVLRFAQLVSGNCNQFLASLRGLANFKARSEQRQVPRSRWSSEAVKQWRSSYGCCQ